MCPHINNITPNISTQKVLLTDLPIHSSQIKQETSFLWNKYASCVIDEDMILYIIYTDDNRAQWLIYSVFEQCTGMSSTYLACV